MKQVVWRLNCPGDIGDNEIDMSEKSLPAIAGTWFEELKQTNQYGTEYWGGRDLQPMLGYSKWRRFEQTRMHR